MRETNKMQSFHVVEVQLKKKKRMNQFEKRVISPVDAGDFLQKTIAYKDREWFCALGLDAKGFVNYFEVIHIGTLTQATIHPREVFKSAIMTNSNSIIIAHNHPSGDVDPSIADRTATRLITDAGKIMGIEVLDHLIISDNKYYSLKENQTYYGGKNGQ